MTELTFVENALAFIEAHLQAPISVADIADAAGYSLYHFCRVFNTTTHHTPYNYLIRRRLAEAAGALVTTDARIIDIALDYQFNNPATFTRACQRVFSAPPSQLRERGVLDPHRLMPALTAAHLTYLVEHREDLRPVFVRRKALHLAGLMTWTGPEATALPELWGQLEALLEGMEDIPAQADRYELRWYPPNWTPCGVSGLAAVALSDLSVDLTGTPLVRKTLSAGTYVHFRHTDRAETLPLLLDYVYHTWLPNADRALAAPFVLIRCDVKTHTLFFPLSLP
jgi:AraC family transcriptional regulator